ncbi:thioesterase [Clostridium sp. D2Q-14]|uniref:thioesterase II family protein n=1 Tax=Anaeromonas gelatinilytica TaxID=2683194 RepID=UPI00193BE929|nr:thioesterase domain-containing protein [Anaeromonas gelatinilytica]MBS4536684.1 thioesterase [Anaeromonas gelatinilytica]
MILFCLPYAGGSEAIYYKWKKYLDSSIELYPIELKGRGKRFDKGFYENLEEAVDDIFNNIKDKIDNTDYAIYGHSMGSLLAYELYYKIKKMGYLKPKHIFFSGYKAPSIIRTKENIYDLPDYDFIKKVMELGGTPEEVFNNKELLEVFLPVIRNDFKILENYNYKEREDKIECDVSILYGNQEAINLEDVLLWKNHVSSGFKIYNLEGNHFFINKNVKNISNIINSTLLRNNINTKEIEYGV